MPFLNPGFKKGGAHGVRGLALKICLVNLGDFLNNLEQIEVGVRPAPSSGSAPGCLSIPYYFEGFDCELERFVVSWKATRIVPLAACLGSSRF